ncbi:MAG TPA: lipoyl synthase [Candidatus Omnitrophica bacterium]|nr:lipoyl synthase [Candidatus Omnitrophota bacterium]
MHLAKTELPLYLKQKVLDSNKFLEREKLFKHYDINTVCKEAHCPNSARCLDENTATFLILGNICSRGCLFCAVEKGKPEAVNKNEVHSIASVVKQMRLEYVVITSVCRDDLEDFGAGQFVKTVDAIRLLSRDIKIELLIPDFCGSLDTLKTVIKSRPECIGHNLETVPRLYSLLNRISAYNRSLEVITRIKKNDSSICVKSGIMLGLGETEDEVRQVFEDLKYAGCDIVTLGQYLSPSVKHFPVKRFLELCEFERYREIGLNAGLKHVLSGPLVRSSYKAKETYQLVRQKYSS